MEKEIKLGKLFQISLWTEFPCFEISYAKCGYFDGRPAIHLGLLFIQIILHLPWINKNLTDNWDAPKYGLAIHDNTVWLYTGKRWKTWDIPFFCKKFYKHYILGKNDEWIDVTYKREGDIFDKHIGYLGWHKDDIPDEESLAKIYYGKWHDKSDDTIIDTKYRVEVRQWRPKWLMWTSLFQFERKKIDVCFKEEVGSEKGSWKGGVLGAGFDFKPEDNDDPELCFARMNKEKNW